ncbi:MAG: PEP-CTERM sorting domain-containing protein [Phycisphaerae bacterium]|jgi:hypothetical protein
MRSIWFSTIIVAVVIGMTTSAFAVPIYTVDDYRSKWGGYSSKIIVTDSKAPHNEVVLNTGTGRRMTDIAVTPSSSSLYTITNDGGTSLYRYDVDDGRLLDSWNLGIQAAGFKNALVAESDTSLLMMSNDKTNLWRINLDSTGNYVSTTTIGNIGKYSSGDLAIAPDGTIYFSSVDYRNSTTARNRLYTIDLAGTKPLVTEIGIIHQAGSNPRWSWLPQIYGLAFDEDGVLYAGRGVSGVAKDVYKINLHDASATFGWTMNFASGINGFASTYCETTNVPEPATICLLGLGALSMVGRKKHA